MWANTKIFKYASFRSVKKLNHSFDLIQFYHNALVLVCSRVFALRCKITQHFVFKQININVLTSVLMHV